MTFRLDIQTQCVASLEVLKEHARVNAHYPKITQVSPHGRKLAVVGSGPEIRHDLEELRLWKGDIWAINTACGYLGSQGIESTFVTVDPLDVEFVVPGNALVATCCHPNLLKRLKSVTVFDMIETHPDGIPGGCVTATRIPSLAMRLGYLDVSFFGCEGSYEDQDHVTHHNGESQEVIVRAGGKDFRIETGLLVQCQDFVKLFNAFPIFKNRSRGLLKAMIEYPDTWEIVAVSAAMKQHLEEVNGKQGLYEHEYKAA